MAEHGRRSPQHLDALAVLADRLEEDGVYALAAMMRLVISGRANGRGHWRRDAEFLVAYMLEHLPRGLPAAARRKAVNEAYPWHPRAGHPYKIWLKVVREMLAPAVRRRAAGGGAAGPLFDGEARAT